MVLPLLGLATGIGKKLLGGAKKTGTAVKSGAKKTISSGKFLAKKSVDKGADLAQSGVEVVKKGTTNVIKGAKFFKKKVGSVGGSISKRLKENATSIKNLLKKGNKKQDKLRTKGTERKKKKESIEKKQGKEKEVESKKSTSGSGPKNILSSLAKSPLNILDKLFGLGGILLGGILVNAAQGLIDKGKKFMEDNKELFDTIGNFLTGVKDAVVGLLDSFTGPESEKGAFDDFAKFGDDGKLLEAPNGGALSEIVKTFTDLGPVVLKLNNLTKNPIVRALEKSGAIKERSITDRAKEFISGKGAGQLDSYEGSTPGATSPPVTSTGDAESANEINDTSPGGRQDDHNENVSRTPATGKGVPFSASKPMQQIYLHWAGTPYNEVPSVYNSIAKGDGTLVRSHAYGAGGLGHTYGRNSRGVGLSIAAMGVKEGKWSEKRAWKEFPPTNAQLNAMTAEAARIAIAWGWKKSDISKSKILTHAEAALQDGYGPGSGDSQMRWDYHYMNPGGRPGSGGEILRNMIRKHYDLMKPTNTNLQTSANITPTENKTLTASAFNQPMDDEGGETIYIQRVNNIQYIPIPVLA